MLSKYQKQNVVLMSGDVHFAQFYDTGCKSLTGMNSLPELTSSGLTHSQADYIPFAYSNMENLTPNFWKTSENS